MLSIGQVHVGSKFRGFNHQRFPTGHQDTREHGEKGVDP